MLFLTITSILLTFIPIVNSEVQAFFRVIDPKKFGLNLVNILDFSNSQELKSGAVH